MALDSDKAAAPVPLSADYYRTCEAVSRDLEAKSRDEAIKRIHRRNAEDFAEQARLAG